MSEDHGILWVGDRLVRPAYVPALAETFKKNHIKFFDHLYLNQEYYSTAAFGLGATAAIPFGLMGVPLLIFIAFVTGLMGMAASSFIITVTSSIFHKQRLASLHREKLGLSEEEFFLDHTPDFTLNREWREEWEAVKNTYQKLSHSGQAALLHTYEEFSLSYNVLSLSEDTNQEALDTFRSTAGRIEELAAVEAEEKAQAKLAVTTREREELESVQRDARLKAEFALEQVKASGLSTAEDTYVNTLKELM